MRIGFVKGKQGIWVMGTALALLVLGVLFFFYWSDKKQVWFCDEIYTYESANGFEQNWPAENVDQWMTGADVEAFFSADWDRLALNDITVRLYSDHVPLYFWLFRMVSFFFFRGSGTVWIGLSINLFFYLFLIEIVYFLFLRLVKKPVVSGAGVFLALIANRLVLEQALTLRMYMMLLWAEVLLLIAGVWVLKSVWRDKLSPAVFLFLFLISVTGFLTHYDFWVFYAIMATLFCLYLLLSAFRRRGKGFWRSRELRSVLIWCVDFGLALCTTIAIFPYCRWNLNRGKGQTALHSLFDFSTEKLQRIAWGYRRLSAAVFGETMPVAVGLIIMFGCIVGGGIMLYRRKEYKMLTGLVLTVLVAQAYQLVICFTMPDVPEERYLWGEITIMMLCMFWGGYMLLQACVLRIANERVRRISRYTAGVVLSACILVGEIAIIDGGRGVAYLFYESKDVNVLKEYDSIPWVVYGPTVGVYSYYDWLIPERICFLTQEDTAEDRTAIREIQSENSFILYIYEDYYSHALELFEQEMDRKLAGSYLFQSTNLSVYLVTAQP